MEKTKKSSLMSKRVFQKYIFLSVLLIVPVANWLLFWFTVNIQSILLAFQDNRTGAFTWWNFQYFWQELTSVDGEIGLAVVNTLKYFFSNLLIVIPLSMIIAFFIYKKIWGYKTFTIIFYLPSIISSVAMVQIYMQMLASGGPIDKLFGGILNIPVEGFFSRPDTATTMIVLYTIWTGFSSNILLFVGAMTRIPIEVFEAAKLEGCKPGREFISIVFPLIWPTISTMLILSFTGLFNASGPILLFGADSATLKTTTISYWIFKEVYEGGMGGINAVSATGLCFTVVAVPLILFVRWVAEKVPAVEY
jgi:ABC transporter, permease protein